MTEMNRGRTGVSERAGARRWDDYRDTYRSDFENRYGGNRRWEDYEPAYRYGWESSQDERFRGREYSDAEPDLESGWTDYSSRSGFESGKARGEHPGTHGHKMEDHQTAGGKLEHAWHNVKEFVREGFDRGRSDAR